jgi:hypothetical protein
MCLLYGCDDNNDDYAADVEEDEDVDCGNYDSFIRVFCFVFL